MEVHAHTHTPRKKWTHYFWEFFMLFLAVFCGFLAENWREHIVEHQREKKYILSLIGDIKKDTSELSNNIISFRERREKEMDSLFRFLKTGSYKQYGNATYFLGRRLTSVPSFFNSDGTMEQLKNAGGLRLIRKQYIVDSIMTYDRYVKHLLSNITFEQEISKAFKETAEGVFDANVFYQIVDTVGNRTIRPEGNPQLLTNDPIIINKVALQVQYLIASFRQNRAVAIGLRERGVSLISFLQKEYNLE